MPGGCRRSLGLPGDAGLLQIAAHRVFVGDRVPPEIADVYHTRDANLLTVVRWILDRLDAGAGSPA